MEKQTWKQTKKRLAIHQVLQSKQHHGFYNRKVTSTGLFSESFTTQPAGKPGEAGQLRSALTKMPGFKVADSKFLPNLPDFHGLNLHQSPLPETGETKAAWLLSTASRAGTSWRDRSTELPKESEGRFYWIFGSDLQRDHTMHIYEKHRAKTADCAKQLCESAGCPHLEHQNCPKLQQSAVRLK